MCITVENKTDKYISCQEESIESKIRSYLKKIDKGLDYDVYIAFQFNMNKNVAVTKSYFAKEIQDMHEKIPYSIFFQNNSNYLFNELIKTKDIIEYMHEDNSRCLFDGIKKEIYVPLFSTSSENMELIGCSYFGTYRDVDIDLKTLSKKIKAYEYISSISYLLESSTTKIKALKNITNIIHVLMMILEKKDSTLFSHSYNVANWCKEIGNELELGESEIKKIYFAGLIHDVGKVFIDDSIINRNGKLTDEEYDIVKRHSLYSYNIAKKILAEYPGFISIPEIIKYHHERYDGLGYPEGLKKDEIPFYSYILSIADSVDAMFSDRPYKSVYSVEKVIRELRKNRGNQFHPELVDVMINIILKAQNQYESLIDNHFSLCYLIINYEEDANVLQGVLIRNGNYYVFKPDDEIETGKIELKEMVSAEIAIKDSTNLFDYNAKIEDVKNNEFYISSIEIMESPNSFNLLWDLEGILYTPKGNEKVSVNIFQIGGNSLRFSLKQNNMFKNFRNKPLRLDILFDDYTVDITGIIVRNHKLGNRQYCGFQYTEIPDFKRDRIYRQLFKKQHEIKKVVTEIE